MPSMRAWLPTFLLLTSSFVLVPGTAINPLDNDADSGGDAGDVVHLALPVEFGTIRGKVSVPHDSFDWYSFEGTAGDRITIDIASDDRRWPVVALHGPEAPNGTAGDTYITAVPGVSPVRFVLPVSGAWYLQVGLQKTGEDDPIESTYAIELTREALDGVVISRLTQPSLGLELRLDQPGDAWVYVRASPANRSTLDEPLAITILNEYWEEGDDNALGPGGTRLWGGRAGDDWQVDALGVGGESPFDAAYPLGRASKATIFQLDEAAGWARIMAYVAGQMGQFDVVVWTDGAWAMAPGGPVTAFTNKDLDGAEAFAPGLNPGGPMSIHTPLPERTMGWALGGGAQLQAVGPDGTAYHSRAPPDDWLLFYYPDAGNWTLHIDAPPQLPNEADRIWFDHVQMPVLDVAPPPPIRLPLRP